MGGRGGAGSRRCSRASFARRRLVADQVVVDEEHAAHAEPPQRVEFAADLLRRLDARLAAEHHDDVAEFAAETDSRANTASWPSAYRSSFSRSKRGVGRIGQAHRAGFADKAPARRRARSRGRSAARCTRPRRRRPRVSARSVVVFRAQRGEAAAGHDVVAAAADSTPSARAGVRICTPMPHTPMRSASGASGTDSTFSSTISTCQWRRAQRRQRRQPQRRIDRIFSRAVPGLWPSAGSRNSPDSGG